MFLNEDAVTHWLVQIWSLGKLPGNPSAHEILHEIIVGGDFDVIGSELGVVSATSVGCAHDGLYVRNLCNVWVLQRLDYRCYCV